MAAERTIELNPLSTAAAYMGTLLAPPGTGIAGCADPARHRSTPTPLQRALSLSLYDHYRRGEYEDALAQRKRSTLSNFVGTPILIAAAAGQLHHVGEARAAFDALEAPHPAFVDPDKARPTLPTGLGRCDRRPPGGRVPESKGARGARVVGV